MKKRIKLTKEELAFLDQLPADGKLMVKPGDRVGVVPTRSFCTGGNATVKKAHDGLITIDDGQVFSCDGRALSPPYEYYLVPIDKSPYPEEKK